MELVALDVVDAEEVEFTPGLVDVAVTEPKTDEIDEVALATTLEMSDVIGGMTPVRGRVLLSVAVSVTSEVLSEE